MCGIAGIVNQYPAEAASMDTLYMMAALLQHRGPDQSGIYRDARCALVGNRLSILDLAGGQQPIPNEDESLWIVYNGEVFNDLALKKDLLEKGHRFQTSTDTEVVLHLYQEYGPDFLRRLNGQYAIAIWDTTEQSLFLARDRIGIRPLFYTTIGSQFAFASEMKAFLALEQWQPEIDMTVLQQIFTYWAPLSPNTIFKGVQEVPPGSYLIWKDNRVQIRSYWSLDFSSGPNKRSEADLVEAFEELLIDAARVRLLRSDVPVGAYLSGGLDSSTIAAVIQEFSQSPLETFSIAFSTPTHDEREFQKQMADSLGVNHHSITCTPEDIGACFSDVIWHTETPILRTSPAPMFLLSQLVHNHKYKVVLTGEGADEILGGYDIYKENYIRRFMSRDPNSKQRPKLIQALYPEIPQLSQNTAFLQAFFTRDLMETASPFYSHHLRWSNTARSLRFFKNAPLLTGKTNAYPLTLPSEFDSWHPLSQAQYLEMSTFLTQYLLSSQGDRVGMAHSVEGRFPFLDYRMIEFANQLPPDFKLRGLQEKWILRKFASKLLPRGIWQRRKKPYRAPIHQSFFSPATRAITEDILSPANVQAASFFNPAAVTKLVGKAAQAEQLSEIEEMALVGMISSQLTYSHFSQRRHPIPHFNATAPVKVVDFNAAIKG